jgi:uncharacterized protein (DUF433 family)
MSALPESVAIVDRGRGPQLSDCKLTVQDLLPYFKDSTPDTEILRWYPQIGQKELDLLRQYYVDHKEEVLALERQIAAEHDKLRKRYPPPNLETDGLSREEKLERLKQKAKQARQEGNGEHRSG